MISSTTPGATGLRPDIPQPVSPAEHNFGRNAGQELSKSDTRIHELGMESLRTKYTIGTIACLEMLRAEAQSRADEGLVAELKESINEHQANIIENNSELFNLVRITYPEQFDETLARVPGWPILQPHQWIANVYRAREEIIDEKTREHQAQIEVCKAEFTDAMAWAAKAGLPVNIDAVKHRVGQVRVLIRDPMAEVITEVRTGRTRGGYYVDQQDVVALDLRIFDEETDQAKAVIFHELLHAVAGMRVSHRVDGQLQRDQQGLRTVKQRNNDKHYSWLDEAVTEQLAQILLESPINLDFGSISPLDFMQIEAGVYAVERSVLQAVLQQIPRDKRAISLLLGAYFENYDPTNPAGLGPQPYRKALHRMLNKYCNVARLDKAYQQGDREALASATISDPLIYPKRWREFSLQRRSDKMVRRSFYQRHGLSVRRAQKKARQYRKGKTAQ